MKHPAHDAIGLMPHAHLTPAVARLNRIARARQLLLHEETPLGERRLLDSWIEHSWQRCLARGMRPGQRVAFDAVSAQAMRRAAESNHQLVEAARPVLAQLGRTLVDTRYFAILTNQAGVVVDTAGPIDQADRRATVITRIGVDLSEGAVGTTAIGAALGELQPVWLHRGEHFFDATSIYSCAGAPLFGPDGRCIGMLDLTGIETSERPELRHLAARSARQIENRLLRGLPHRLLLRLQWPGAPEADSDGLLALDTDGCVVGANSSARQLLPLLTMPASTPLHCRDLFAMPFEMLFDAARHMPAGLEVPLWSGLRLHVSSHDTASPSPPVTSPRHLQPLRDVETELIRQAVQSARGNVAQAARALGISRATIYRKLRPNR